MTIQAVVFDLWYTLVCPEDHGRTHRTIGGIVDGLGLDADGFDRFWSSRLDEMYRTPRTIEDHIADHLASLGRDFGDDERAVLDGLWSYHDEALATPRIEVIEGITALRERGLAIGLCSNAHEREMRGWTSSPLASLFDAIFISCREGPQKPEPEAYRAVLDRLGVAAADAMFVGDGSSDELRGARAAGFGRVVFMRGLLAAHSTSADLAAHAADADATIDSIADVASVLV